jgi:hypothetical protein
VMDAVMQISTGDFQFRRFLDCHLYLDPHGCALI